MFVLPRRQFPDSAADLAAAMEEGLRKFARRDEQMVTAVGANARSLDRLAIDLSGATLDLGQRPPRPQQAGESSAAVRVFSVVAQPLRVMGGAFNFRLQGDDVAFTASPTAGGEILLTLEKVGRGGLEVSIARSELEKLLAQLAREQAAKQGVTIDGVQGDFRVIGPRAIEAKVSVAARKVVFRATLALTGTVEIDDDFVARFQNLKCKGDGAIASVACAAISAQFAKVENRVFPLAALPLGQSRLRNLELYTDADTIGARAEVAA